MSTMFTQYTMLQVSTDWTIRVTNDARFWPEECKKPTFSSWALRVALRIANLPAGSSDNRMHQAIFVEGMPCAAWLSALMFMMELAQLKKTAVQHEHR